MEVPTEPIRVEVAEKQHNHYVEQVRKLLPKIVEVFLIHFCLQKSLKQTIGILIAAS